MMAAYRKRKAEKDEQRKADAPRLIREVAALRNTIALHKGTRCANEAAVRLEELTHSMEYLTNMYVFQKLESMVPPENAVVGAPKVAKLPWDQDEFIRMPFCKRDEYIRTHSQSSEA